MGYDTKHLAKFDFPKQHQNFTLVCCVQEYAHYVSKTAWVLRQIDQTVEYNGVGNTKKALTEISISVEM